MSFKDNLSTMRYQQGESWFDRSQKGVEDLDDLRQHRGFAYLMDIYDGNLRAQWNAWLSADMSPEDAEKVRQKAMWLRDLVNELNEISSEKGLREAQAKCYEGFTADADIASANAEHVEAGNY